MLCSTYSTDIIFFGKLENANVDIKNLLGARPLKKEGGGLVIRDLETKSNYFVVYITNKKLVVECYSEQIDLRTRNSLLLKFLEILNVINNNCHIRLKSICGYFSEAIISSSIIGENNIVTKNYDVLVEQLSSSNSILAIELRNLLIEKAKIENDNSQYKKFCTNIFASFGSVDPSALKGFGVDESDAAAVLKLTGEQ